MKYFFWLLFICFNNSNAQKLKKADKATLVNLQQHISYLASDALEGRRTGSAGEQLAYNYIINEYTKMGLEPKGENGSFLQPFEIIDGKIINPSTHLIINGNDLKINKDFFPLTCSPNTSLQATTAIGMQESKAPWFYNIGNLIESNKTNPHFDIVDALKAMAINIAQKGANALIVYNTSAIDDGIRFDVKSKDTALAIPIVYVTKTQAQQLFKDETAIQDIQLKVLIEQKKRVGHNVIAFKNNNAATTIIIGAHYDHLGYGEDHNSLFTGTEPQIHNGADDNASGTAAVIELSKMLSASAFANNNYLFIHFSGEELGLYGSKYFTEHSSIPLAQANYMVNLDMVGRLNDSTHGLTIAGFGTSPTWGEVITTANDYFSIKVDSSGTGPSDHTSFYRKNIPVLFFFTGLHSDYHKPSDDADKINYTGTYKVVKYIYELVGAVNNKGKLNFTTTKERATSTKSNFKVTLGIMPDYTFSGIGVRADGVSEGKLAQKVGIKAGDVIIKLGNYYFNDVQAYMDVLSKFKKGDATTVTVQRGAEKLEFNIVF